MKKTSNLDLSTQEISDLYFTFRALADKTRLRALAVIASGDAAPCVTDVANALDISVAAASYQLKELERAGFLTGEKEGKTTCYSLNNDNEFLEMILRSKT